MNEELEKLGIRLLQQVVGNSSRIRIEDYKGGKIVRNVTLLSSGTWTDSKMKVPLYYPPDVIERYVHNWKKNGLWDKHAGNAQRAIIDRVGEILNPRYENSAMVGDLFFSMNTQNSRDTFALVESGIAGITEPVHFSMEHDGDGHRDRENNRYVADTLVHLGGAVVDVGASAGTRILSQSENQDTTNDEEKKKELQETATMDEELKAALDKIEARLTALEGKAADGADPGAMKAELQAATKEAAISAAGSEVGKAVEPIATEVKELKKVVAELSKKAASKSRELAEDDGIPQDAVFPYDGIIVKGGEVTAIHRR